MRLAVWNDRSQRRGRSPEAAWAVSWATWAGAVALSLGLSAACLGAEMAPAASTSGAVSKNLRQLLDGAAPKGAGDLRAMQEHVQKLSDQVKKCTVGVQVGQAWGSGVIISKDGYVLTAAHVAGKPNLSCTFTMADGKEVKGTTLGLFRTLDAGLMKITEEGEYSFAELGNSSQLRVGQWCIAMGHPGGYQSERGAVLRMGRVLLLDDEAITTNCTLVGGDSGGPLFDMDGRVIGINSRIAELLTTNMHVPVNAFHERDAWNRMVKGEAWGHLPGHKPWLGIVGDGEATEARIASVKDGSPAKQASLKAGDVVVEFEGKKIESFSALTEAVDECRPNKKVKVKVRRGSDLLDLEVQLGRKS